MPAIEQLKVLLGRNTLRPFTVVDVAAIGRACEWRPLKELKETNEKLKKRLGEPPPLIPEDQIREALRRFWNVPRYESFRDAMLVCDGLALPLEESRPSLIDDRERFPAALSGLVPWMEQPLLYCYIFSGLMHSYFSCDPEAEPENAVRKENWRHLREHLRKNSGKLLEEGKFNPDWVHCVQEHVRLFGDAPCAFYAEAFLNGGEADAVLKPLREQLRITASSWFHRELVLGQVKMAAAKGDAVFTPLLDRLLNLLEANTLLRGPGLTVLLERYIHIPGRPLHPALRDVAVRWWKPPWFPLAAHWNEVSQAAKDMVAGWLKRKFIESFFQKLADDGNRDDNKRRAKFWLRYVKSMGDIRFALAKGWQKKALTEPDLQTLLDKMLGLTPTLGGNVLLGSALGLIRK